MKTKKLAIILERYAIISLKFIFTIEQKLEDIQSLGSTIKSCAKFSEKYWNTFIEIELVLDYTFYSNFKLVLF